MSVIQADRDESRLDFFYQAIQLRKELTLLLLRDFGVKDKIRTLKTPLKGFNRLEMGIINFILKRHNCKGLIYSYPSGLIDYFRNNILKASNELISNITLAYNIHPIILEECHQKRIYIDLAIGNCEQLLQEMQYVLSVIPVDANKYMRYTEMIVKEKDLLKGGRKDNNKIWRNIEESSSGNN